MSSNNNKPSVFAVRIRLAMKKRRVTHAKLGKSLGGVHRTTVGSWLNPQIDRMPSGLQLINIARALGVSVNWLLGEREDPRRAVFLTDHQEEILRIFDALGETGQRAAIETLRDTAAAMEKARNR